MPRCVPTPQGSPNHDAEEVDQQYAEDNKRAHELGAVFDSDPRSITQRTIGSRATGP
jgi:capsid protein